MPYEYLDGFSIADVAFRAEGAGVGELFREACDATMGVMVENLSSVEARVKRPVTLSSDSAEMLLFKLLQELLFFKDAERLLLRLERVDVTRTGDGAWRLSAVLAGEPIDSAKHILVVDVKAVTLHRLSVEETPGGWHATVVLDV